MLLLDEVAAGLTTEEVQAFIEHVKSIRDSGVSIVLVEHVMKAIMSLSDRIVVLDQGKKIADDKPESVVTDSQVIEAFLGVESVT